MIFYEYDVITYYDGLGNYRAGMVVGMNETGLEISDGQGSCWIDRRTKSLRRVHASDPSQDFEARRAAAIAARDAERTRG